MVRMVKAVRASMGEVYGRVLATEAVENPSRMKAGPWPLRVTSASEDLARVARL